MSSSSGPAIATGLVPEAAEVNRLLAKGNTKSAVELAKSIHKRSGSPDSEALLIEAYVARAKSMFDHRLTAEAEALIAMVRQRYPAWAARFDLLQSPAAATGVGLDELVRPWTDPAAPEVARAGAERAIRKDLVDLSALANCSALPADHALRRGAQALRNAFNAVASHPVEDAELALPEISRRSPLAPWKPLVRAIACFYRHEDAACLEHLRAVDPDSAPARLVPALEAMLAGRTGAKLTPAAAALGTGIGANLDGLRAALKSVDEAFENGGRKRILDAIRNAVSLAQQQCPEILVPFRQQVAVLAMFEDVPPAGVISALGGAPKGDARSHLLLARALERNEDTLLMACHTWETFRKLSISEHWFAARGPEVATVYLHMAKLAARVDREELDEEYRSMRAALPKLAPEGFDATAVEAAYLHTDWLFEQACGMDPYADNFREWVEWAEAGEFSQTAQQAAEQWRRTLPEDPRPLLRLMRYAEDRNALKKAFDYLREAEALDGVNSEVRRARLRLLILRAIRHLKQRKPHLAAAELSELEALPQARENDRPAFVAALRFIAWTLAGEGEKAIAAGSLVQKLLGSSLAGSFALAGVGSLCDQRFGVRLEGASGSWLEAVPRVCAMLQDLGFRFFLPEEWKPEILRELEGRCTADFAALERLGRVALRQNWEDVAYAVSAAGLRQAGAHNARFLLLRAQVLSDDDSGRCENCLMAALSLARRANDAALANEVVEFWRDVSIAAAFGVEPSAMNQRRARSVLERERRALLPERTERSPFDDDDFDDFDEDFDDPFGLPLPPARRSRKSRGRTAVGQQSLF